jgi:hypothetical protein
MVEVNRDGKRGYWINSLYSTWELAEGLSGELPDTARIRPGSTAATARRMRSANLRAEP